jgi:hypothetical protein
MMTQRKNLDDHERFRELGALANSGALSAGERAELKGHLQICKECREAYDQYRVLAKYGVPLLGARYSHCTEEVRWDDTPTREELFAHVGAAEQQAPSRLPDRSPVSGQSGFLRHILGFPPARATLAACLVLAVALGAYRLGGRAAAGAKQARASAEDRYQTLMAERRSARDLLQAQTKELARFVENSSEAELELAQLRSALRALEDREKELTTAKRAAETRAKELEAVNGAAQDQLRTVAQQRDALSAQLRDAEKVHLSVQAELASLRSQRDKAADQAASLESRIEDLTAANRAQGRLLRDDEQYLAADRDIRDLMGARQLYIADVLDVDSRSHTQKPYGRIFYTRGKSLIFYAFDLDSHPRTNTASTLQAWGQRGTDQLHPVNLGILYNDSQLNRRWVLRIDDPEKLAEITTLFVTVEPKGGSPRPSSKPFLYALLRKEINHP